MFQNPPTKIEYIKEILPCLVRMLAFEDKQIKADTCWALSYITDGPNERISMVLDVSIFDSIEASFNK